MPPPARATSGVYSATQAVDLVLVPGPCPLEPHLHLQSPTDKVERNRSRGPIARRPGAMRAGNKRPNAIGVQRQRGTLGPAIDPERESSRVSG